MLTFHLQRTERHPHVSRASSKPQEQVSLRATQALDKTTPCAVNPAIVKAFIERSRYAAETQGILH